MSEMPKRKFRELVFQALYAQDLSADLDVTTLMPQYAGHLEAIEERVLAVLGRRPKIDGWLKNISKEYDFERISAVEKNVLRLALFEMCFDDAIPPKVAISEAIRIMRKYGTKEGGSFVNALLDTLSKQILE